MAAAQWLEQCKGIAIYLYMTRNNISRTENNLQSRRKEIQDWAGTKEKIPVQ